ncbi:MAG: nucleoside 2-deoxyribosyltransferase [Candidatus Thiodiazotropha sp. (ex Dulcina madagascariensis)]|nr:nucleoside 2-deoxyribosyltransferase [Candidatus Thiodiazotropha sp. (ex Dulcina madagascariensis)]
MNGSGILLIVGEIIVDFTLPQPGVACKLRLGGIAHAARGLWAVDCTYAVAAVCPKYLVTQAKNYLTAHGCLEFIWLGEIYGSPNVIAIGDPTELSDQGYEDLLRDEKSSRIFHVEENLQQYTEALVFPGCFDLAEVKNQFSDSTKFSFDIAYGISDLSQLEYFSKDVRAVIISTSSDLFQNKGSENLDDLLSCLQSLSPEVFLLKENRGGSRIFEWATSKLEEIPATLGVTVNSVGVGDVYSAVLVALRGIGWPEASWRGSRTANYYAQTTYPDNFRRDVQRDLKLSVESLRSLGGTFLPWHERQNFPIYLAGPDFSYVEKREFDVAADSLTYHNFLLRRPILENGQIDRNSGSAIINETYELDISIIRECAVVFAVPLGRDPGTLVEIGIAIEMGKPIITYDPRKENNNTMVIGGSEVYSDNLDSCLNGLFEILSKLRAEQ